MSTVVQIFLSAFPLVKNLSLEYHKAWPAKNTRPDILHFGVKRRRPIVVIEVFRNKEVATGGVL